MAPTESPAMNRPTARRVGGRRWPSAAACRGISRRNTSHPSGTVDSAIAAPQETNTPSTGIAPAKTISSTSLPSENTALPSGTQTASRSPVSTPSCRVRIAQATHEATKRTPATGVPSGAYEGPQRSRVSRKTTPATATTSELTA